ncbi:DeoR faimly transcriptional regulator [Cupriavidus sp. SK-4]|uniref:Diacylglycerol kinase n=1 Tax=Cupriavidus necator TaxID=106590 RepID=A0A1K0IKL0_CUPNE|nr:diacylglycerol kinase [Cupriavidus sp. SK-4]EYS92956.1 DeoR faimly transcriptional regulator [Cupriavidus sp. SK-4]SCU73298.1 Membrane protein [Cupriavidus necator]
MSKPHPELPSDPPLQRPPQAVQSADYSIEQNPHKGNRGLTRAWHAAINSLSGLRYAVLEESAFRQELTLVVILAPWAFLLPVDVVERILLLGTLLVVLIVELLNSSVEAAIDRISLERHSLSKRAKDFGSAAVMLALVLCGGTWVAIAGPHVVRWVRALAG